MNIRRIGFILVTSLSVGSFGLVACGSSDASSGDDASGGGGTGPSLAGHSTAGAAGKATGTAGSGTGGTGQAGSGAGGTIGGAGKGTGGTGTNGGNAATNGGAAGTGTGGAAVGSECAAVGTSAAGGSTAQDQACITCCSGDTGMGQQTFTSALFTECGCTATTAGAAAAPCAAQCASFCSGGQPSTDCETCIDNTAQAGTDSCLASATTDCDSDADCSAFSTCANSCGGGATTVCGSGISVNDPTCAACVDPGCCTQVTACDGDPACQACLGDANAATDACAQNANFTGLNSCLSGTCGTACGGGGGGVCGTGISITDPTCAACVDPGTGPSGGCCMEATACDADPACQACVGSSDPSCMSNALITALNSCITGAKCGTACNGGAVQLCGGMLQTTDATAGACINANCCDTFTPCESDAACDACLQNPTGAGCSTNALLQAESKCESDHMCNGEEDPICMSGIILTPSMGDTSGDTKKCADCLGADATCCAAYTACGKDDNCIPCLQGKPVNGFDCTTDTVVANVNTCDANTCVTECGGDTGGSGGAAGAGGGAN